MEDDAILEAFEILDAIGDQDFSAERSDISGIVWGDTSLDPISIPSRVRDMVCEEPWCVRYIRRIIPIQKTTATSSANIRDALLPLVSGIKSDETYRITLEKRNSGISGRNIIDTVAQTIPNAVSLETPDVVVLIQVLGAITGVSVVRSGGIFSLDLTKRSISQD